MKRLKSILEKIENELKGLVFKDSSRNNMSAALFDISLDHANAIVELITRERPIIASSYALVRPMFENFARAAWILECASDPEIEKIKKKDKYPLSKKTKRPISISEMLEAVDKKREWPSTLEIIWDQAKQNMHSYTHGGIQLISRRFKDGILEHVLDQKEIDGVARFLAMISFLSFCQIVLIAETTEKDEFIKSLGREVMGNYQHK